MSLLDIFRFNFIFAMMVNVEHLHLKPVVNSFLAFGRLSQTSAVFRKVA